MHSSTTVCPDASAVDIDRCAALILSAEAELSAFMWAVDSSSGRQTALIAGEYWVTELETAGLLLDQKYPDWRLVTLAATLQLMKKGHLLDYPKR